MKTSGLLIGLFLMAGLFGTAYTMYSSLGSAYGITTPTSAYSNTFSGVTATQNDLQARYTTLNNLTTQDSITPVGGITTTVSIIANIYGLTRDMLKLPLDAVIGSGKLISVIASSFGLGGSPLVGMLITIFVVLIMAAIIAMILRWYW